MKDDCKNCAGCRAVCENHPDHPWAGLADVEPCCGGAGMPCGACDLQMASAGYVSRERAAIVAWLRSTAPGREAEGVFLIIADAIERGEHLNTQKGD